MTEDTAKPDGERWPRPSFGDGGPSAADASRQLADRLAAEATGVTESRDAAAPAPDETPGRSVPLVVPHASRRDTRRLLLGALAAVTLVLLVTALAVTGYVAEVNKDRAGRWEERSLALERNVDQLNGVLVERSNELNARTRELNGMASKVRRQQSALRRSEADVSSLEDRQRALAAEKAEVEDERAALLVQSAAIEEVADAVIACNGGLAQLLGYVLDEDYYSASAIVSEVRDDCDYAEYSLDDYNARFG